MQRHLPKDRKKIRAMARKEGLNQQLKEMHQLRVINHYQRRSSTS